MGFHFSAIYMFDNFFLNLFDSMPTFCVLLTYFVELEFLCMCVFFSS